MPLYPEKPLRSLGEHLARLYNPAQIQAALQRSQPVTIQARKSFLGWTAEYLPHYLTLDISPFHRWLESLLTGLHLTRGQNWDILAPRGSAKTTWSTTAYPLYCALEGLERFTVLSSDTGSQAHAYVGSIRAELEGNDRLRADYAHVIAGMKCVQGHIRMGNGCAIECSSTGGKIRGRKNGPWRPTLIVVDDPQNIEHVISPIMRGNCLRWMLQDVMMAGTPETNVLMLGTALHRECLVCDFSQRIGWKSRTWKALDSYPERMDLWEEWKQILFNYDDLKREASARAFYETSQAAMDKGAVALWPEREDIYTLMMSRASNGPAAFESEKQNNPINPEACEWPADYFQWPGMWFEKWPMENLVNKVIALDPSKGRDGRVGDYSAIILAGKDAQGRKFFEGDLERRSTEAMIADTCKHVKAFDPAALVLETNQYQELLKPIIHQVAEALGVTLPPIVSIENMEHKPLRIRRLGPMFAQKAARFKRHSPGTQLLIDQLMDFPNGSHDDGPDGMEMADRRLKDDKSFDLL